MANERTAAKELEENEKKKNKQLISKTPNATLSEKPKSFKSGVGKYIDPTLSKM